jgi:hypothetical protein
MRDGSTPRSASLLIKFLSTALNPQKVSRDVGKLPTPLNSKIFVPLRAALGAFAVGIDYQALRFLLSAQRDGVSFERSLMLGRQNYYFLSLKQARRIFRQFPDAPPKGEIARMLGAHYIEPLLEYLGGRDVQSLDVSGFETASILHDMNEPIPPTLRTRFTAVLDLDEAIAPRHDQQISVTAVDQVATRANSLWIDAFIPGSTWRSLAHHRAAKREALLGSERPKEQLRAELVESMPHEIIARGDSKEVAVQRHHLHGVFQGLRIVENML